MFRRIGLFLLTNILVITTIHIVLGVLGVHGYLTRSGIDYQSLLVFCLVWGMVGSFISLALSRFMAKMTMGVQVIPPDAAGDLRWLVELVHSISRKAGMTTMPEVGIFPSAEVNAFATGPTKHHALVAVSQGLLRTMDREEIAGVIGHEVSHIVNGDMVTMTLLQGIVNAFVMFLARVIAFTMTQNMREDDRRAYEWIIVMVLQMAFTALGMLVVAWFSRFREFRADSGSARLVGKTPMREALQELQRLQGGSPQGAGSMATYQINGQQRHSLFATHPPLAERIARLDALPA